MKKLLLVLFIVLPAFCGAQEYMAGKLSENRVDDATGDTIVRSYWQVMERGLLNRKLNTFYRISRINNNIFLDLKIIEGGSVFVVARNAELKLILEDGNILKLYNAKYEVSCAGCGARGDGGGNIQGVMLTFPMDAAMVHKLQRNYIAAIGINTGEDYLQKSITPTHSEMFMDELWHISNRSSKNH